MDKRAAMASASSGKMEVAISIMKSVLETTDDRLLVYAHHIASLRMLEEVRASAQPQ